MTVHEEKMKRHAGGYQHSKTQAQREATMKEINPLPERKLPVSEEVTIEHDADHMAYYVSLPRRGRLGDRRIYDAETGLPVNIGPTRQGPAPWRTIPEALAHFKRVADAFERLL